MGGAESVFLGDLLGEALGGLLGGAVGGWFRRRNHSEAEADAAQGKPLRLTAAIRMRDRRFLAGRWRHGTAMICAGEIRWAPRWPRMGRRFVLCDVAIRGRRRLTTLEKWFVHPGLVIVECSATAGRYELAVFPEDLRFLYPARGAEPRPRSSANGAIT